MVFIFFVISNKNYCQDYITIKFKKGQQVAAKKYIGSIINKDGKITAKYALTFADPELNRLINKYDIVYFGKEYPTAEKFSGINAEILNKVYRIELANNVPDLFNKLSKIKFIDIDEVLKGFYAKTLTSVNPNDYYDTHNVTCYPNIAWGNGNLDLINVKKAWELTRGLSCVTVGIVDEDFQHHNDIDAKVLNINSLSIESSTVNTHGTQVSGLVAAIPDNNFGSVGVGNQVTLRYYKGLTYDNILKAVSDGCKVVNCSWYSSFSSTIDPNPDEQMVIDMAYENGVTVVAAAGNCNGGNCDDYFYPASYNHVISVSSVGYHYPIGSPQIAPYQLGEDWIDCHDAVVAINGHSSVENYQSNSLVDICAPGRGVEVLTPVTPTWTNGIVEGYGTSFSSPTVAGVAALLYSINPNFTPTQIKNFIKQNAVDIYNISYNQQYIGQLGAGRLDAGAAVAAAANSNPCLPNFSGIAWKSGTTVINNNNYWQYLNNSPTLTFKISSSAVSSGATVEWEIISGDKSVTRIGTTVSIQWGVDFTAMIGDKQRYDVFPLEVYARQIKDCCASAFYKEKGYSPLVADGSVSGPYPIYNCKGNALFENNMKLLPGYYKARNIYAGTYYGSNTSSTEIDPGFITDYIASNEIVLKPGFHAAPNSNGYFQAIISANCDYFNPYYTPCNNLPSNAQNIFVNSNSENSNIFLLENTHTNDIDIFTKVFPNPFSKRLNIYLTTINNQNVMIKILNSSGQNIFMSANNYLNKSFSKTIQVDLSKFSKGSYFVEVIGNNSVQTTTVIMY